MRIIGIDPGTNIIGWGVIEKTKNTIIPIAYNSIIIKSNVSLDNKLEIIYDSLLDVILNYSPDVASVEELFFVKNIKTGISVGHARGVILLLLKQRKIDIFSYKPLEVKQSIVGYGKATKLQVQIMVKNILKLRELPTPDDTADALALAICHENRAKFFKLIKEV